jgi:hypothetical protein
MPPQNPSEVFGGFFIFASCTPSTGHEETAKQRQKRGLLGDLTNGTGL